MGFEPRAGAKMEAASDMVSRMDSALEEARAAAAKAKSEMKQYYDRRRTPPPVFGKGDRVYLDASDIKTIRPSQKLSHRRLGPFEILEAVRNHSYRLRLPKQLSRLHPVFNVIKLTAALPDPITGRRASPPPLPELIDGEEEYEVEQILNSRIYRRRLEYLIRWKGYGIEHDEWVPAKNVQNAPEALAEYHCQHPAAPRNLRAVHFDSIAFWDITSGRWDSKGGAIVRGTPLTVDSALAALSDASASEYDEDLMQRLAQLDADRAEVTAPRRAAQEMCLCLSADRRLSP